MTMRTFENKNLYDNIEIEPDLDIEACYDNIEKDITKYQD